MGKEHVKISVIMPVYNAGDYLKNAVESVLKQSFEDYELILVDDGSTDDSPRNCDELAEKDNRIVVIHQDNGGICCARNAALQIAKGEYVAFCDHDDEYQVDLLRDNYYFAKKENLDFVKFCKKWYYIQDGRILSEHRNYAKKQIVEKNDLKAMIYELMDSRFCSCVWDGLFKKKFLDENQIAFDPFFKMGGEDFDFVLKCMRNVEKFGINDECYYVHYIRLSYSTSTKLNPEKMNVVKILPKMFLDTLLHLGVDLQKTKSDYTLFYTKFYLSSVLACLKKQKKTASEAAAYLKELENESFYLPFLRKTSIPLEKNFVYAVMHFLFAKKLYKTLYVLYTFLK